MKPPSDLRARQPLASAAAREAADARRTREAEALRANLLRRKQQLRARAANAPAQAGGGEDEPG